MLAGKKTQHEDALIYNDIISVNVLFILILKCIFTVYRIFIHCSSTVEVIILWFHSPRVDAELGLLFYLLNAMAAHRIIHIVINRSL